MEKKKIIKSLHHLPSLRETLSRMAAEGRITNEDAVYIDSHLDEWVADSKYIIVNLGAHIAIAFIRFGPFLFFLPIGSILRVIWVIGNRIYCDIKRDWHKKEIQSLVVLLVSAIPFLGYFAYTIPLRKKSEHLTYLYAEHICYMLYNMTFEQRLNKAPGFVKKIAYNLLVPTELRRVG